MDVSNVAKAKQIVLEIEAAAQDVLINKEEIVALDLRRQKTREAYWALKNDIVPKEKTWLSFGSVFVKTRTDKAKSLLERDMKELDKEIIELRDKLKSQVKVLRDLEGKPDLQGFDLKPLTREAETLVKAFS